MKIRPFDVRKDYVTVAKWWLDWGWDVVPYEYLPPTGFIVSIDEKDVCCAWLYKTDSAFCILDLFISTKDVDLDKEDRKECFNYLIQKASDFAKQIGFKAIFAYSRNNHLSRKLQNNGFAVHDDQMTNFLKKLE